MKTTELLCISLNTKTRMLFVYAPPLGFFIMGLYIHIYGPINSRMMPFFFYAISIGIFFLTRGIFNEMLVEIRAKGTDNLQLSSMREKNISVHSNLQSYRFIGRSVLILRLKNKSTYIGLLSPVAHFSDISKRTQLEGILNRIIYVSKVKT